MNNSTIGEAIRKAVWDSVYDSLWYSTYPSVRDSVYDSVGVPVRRSVCYLIGRSSKDYFKQND
jgi:hypothetical protein